jgi:L-fucose mutarotase
MLKGIDPLLTPLLLKTLAEMGHDDTLVIADCNYTAVRLAAGKPIIRLPGISMLRAVQAVTSILPLAVDIDSPAQYMQVSDTPPAYRSALQREVCAHLQPLLLTKQTIQALERFAFYEQAKQAFATIVTGEAQPFGNFILHKGVIGEALRP